MKVCRDFTNYPFFEYNEVRVKTSFDTDIMERDMEQQWKTCKKYENMTVQEKWSILATVANLYYNSEMTQNEIADRMYTSRSKNFQNAERSKRTRYCRNFH